MPQIQILPSVPSFGSRLADALGEAANTIGEGYAQKRNQEQITNLTGQLSDPNKTPLEKIGIFTKLTGRLRPDQVKALTPYYSDLLYQDSENPSPTGRTVPGTPTQPGVPQGPNEPITATTQPTAVENALAPTGQTPQEIEARKKMLIRRSGLPGGVGTRAQKELQDIEHQENLALKKQALDLKKTQITERNIDKSYENQKDFIDNVSKQNQSWETEFKPRLLQLQALNDEELIGPGAAKVLETLGIPLGALENPSNELFQKVSQDLLKGLPDSFGSRILKVEVDNFLRTIPTLSNSPDGRRLITSNMLKLGEMKEVYYNEMRRQQKENLAEDKKFPKDFEQEVFDNVKPQIDRINSQFQQLSQIKSVPENTVPYFNPEGGISFIPQTPEDMDWASKNGGTRIW
jgi:hypothetical protein